MPAIDLESFFFVTCCKFYCRTAGLSHTFRAEAGSCRAWLLPEDQKGQRYSAP